MGMGEGFQNRKYGCSAFFCLVWSGLLDLPAHSHGYILTPWLQSSAMNAFSNRYMVSLLDDAGNSVMR